MITNLIGKFKSARKSLYLNSLSKHKKKFGFIGVGGHSLSNLYPSIADLNIPLSVIHSRTIANANAIASKFSNCRAMDDIDAFINTTPLDAVFICAQPTDHFGLVSKCLQKGKHVFIEKPPCSNIQELQSLISLENNLICFPALQRRFGKINSLLKRKGFTDSVISYTYQYCTGLYPEGDILSELFIHPIDNIVQLFGDVSSIQFQKSTVSSYQILIAHKKGAKGIVELSSNGSWKNPIETLHINTSKEAVTAEYPNKLSSMENSGSFLNIPFEKISKKPITKKIYLDNTGFSPTAENNSLLIQGFYSEVKKFAECVEGNIKDEMASLRSLIPVYSVIETLRKG